MLFSQQYEMEFRAHKEIRVSINRGVCQDLISLIAEYDDYTTIIFKIIKRDISEARFIAIVLHENFSQLVIVIRYGKTGTLKSNS